MSLYVIILTYNEARHIESCIESARFADAVLVFDSFSTDGTVDIVRGLGVEVTQRKFDDYAGQRNAALEYVQGKADWVLFVDADERVTPQLAIEVYHAIASSSCVAWQIPRYNYIFGKLTKGAGWYPDYQTRLLKVGFVHYDPARKVHELVMIDGALGTLNEHFVHLNYESVQQFHAKQLRYCAYDAQILCEQGIRPKPQNYVLQPLRQFWWRYFTLRGYRDGLHGLRLSLLMSWYELRKYSYLREYWRKKQKGRE